MLILYLQILTSSYWYAMPIERARYKQSILPGTWTLKLGGYNSQLLTSTNNNSKCFRSFITNS